MCGIIGGTEKDWAYEAANQKLSHRGPDSRGTISHQDLTLSFTRLSIVDLAPEADQPMISSCGSLRIVFNGEIYGYKVLREKLKALGHRFRTHSDTEVVLNAFQQWGDDFVEHIDGMFAIGIHDLQKRKLRLYRDRPGIKPLYYFYIPGKYFAFASELKAIKELCQGIRFEWDYTAVYDYFTYGYVPDPKSFYKHVFKLPPAHTLTFDLSSKKVEILRRYWTLNPDLHPRPMALDVAAERTRDLISESVREQLVADVPVGAFLSGGIDSSVIVSEIAGIDPMVKSYSIGFDDPQYDETHYSKMVADHLGIGYRSKILSSDRMKRLFLKLPDWFDEPYSDTSAYPSFLVAQFARRDVTVVLTGDGGDEIFGGYGRYEKILNQYKYRKPNRILNKWLLRMARAVWGKRKTSLFFLIEKITGEDLAAYVASCCGATTFIKSDFRKRYAIPDDYDTYWYYRQYDRTELPLLTRLQFLDFHTYLPSDILTKVDRVTMANSLEARVPLLSRKIIEFSFSLPETVRYHHSQGRVILKGLLKYAYRDCLPRPIFERKKMGFAVPNDYLRLNHFGKRSLEAALLADFFPDFN